MTSTMHCNVHTIATILCFIAISQLAQSTKSAIYAKLVTFLRQNKNGENGAQHFICQLGATAMRVEQGDEDEANCTCLNSFNN